LWYWNKRMDTNLTFYPLWKSKLLRV